MTPATLLTCHRLLVKRRFTESFDAVYRVGAENSAAARDLGFVVRQTSPPSDRQDRASWLSDCCI